MKQQKLQIKLWQLFDQYELNFIFIAYVKDKGSNLNVMASAFKSIVWCEVLSLDESFQGTCFGHAFLKACKYVIIDEKVYKNLRFVFIKFA